MILPVTPPVRAPAGPVVPGARPVAFSPVRRVVPAVPVLPENRPAAFLIMLPKFM